MLIGAGIGMTPCASILRGALKYKWRKGYDPKTLHFFWTVRYICFYFIRETKIYLNLLLLPLILLSSE